MHPGSIPGQASIASFQTDQTGAVTQPMTVAALTVAATMVIVTATRALRFTKNRMLSNMAKLPRNDAQRNRPHGSSRHTRALIAAG